MDGPMARKDGYDRFDAPGSGDIYRIYLDCQRDGINFNLAYIPDDFDLKPIEVFEPLYNGKLYDLAYQLSSNGYSWAKAMPGLDRWFAMRIS